MEDLSTKHRKIITMKENNNTVEPREHPLNTDTSSLRTGCSWGKKTLTISLNSISLKRTPHQYGMLSIAPSVSDGV